MTRPTRVPPALLLFALLLSACRSSPQTHYFALEPLPPAQAPTGPARALKVDAVHVPALLDRRALVRHLRDHELEVSATNRWAADLGEMIRNVLTLDLQNRLPPDTVIPARAPAPRGARGLVVTILRFAPDGSGSIVLGATWALLDGSPPVPVLTRSTAIREPSGDSASNEAAAMSRALGALADAIATAAREPADPHGGAAARP